MLVLDFYPARLDADDLARLATLAKLVERRSPKLGQWFDVMLAAETRRRELSTTSRPVEVELPGWPVDWTDAELATAHRQAETLLRFDHSDTVRQLLEMLFHQLSCHIRSRLQERG